MTKQTWGPYDNERTDAEREAKDRIADLRRQLSEADAHRVYCAKGWDQASERAERAEARVAKLRLALSEIIAVTFQHQSRELAAKALAEDAGKPIA